MSRAVLNIRVGSNLAFGVRSGRFGPPVCQRRSALLLARLRNANPHMYKTTRADHFWVVVEDLLWNRKFHFDNSANDNQPPQQSLDGVWSRTTSALQTNGKSELENVSFIMKHATQKKITLLSLDMLTNGYKSDVPCSRKQQNPQSPQAQH